jgi:peptidyl-prolyl cis-trans isomerase D
MSIALIEYCILCLFLLKNIIGYRSKVNKKFVAYQAIVGYIHKSEIAISRPEKVKGVRSVMAVLNDIREKSPKFIIAGAAILFIILIVFDWGLDLTGRRGRGNIHSEMLGKVNGKEVSYKQFSELLRRTEENQKKQQNTELDEETLRQLRSQVWNQLVDEMLIEQEIDRLGITVPDQEIRDVVMGPNPPQFLIQQFTDSTGTFRRDAYQRAMMDPQNKQAWIQVEEVIRGEQKRKKLQSLLFADINMSEGEIKQRFMDRNVSMSADFVLFDINRMVADTAVTVTDDDLRKQYNEHPEDFKAKASRKVKYVFFNQNPSSEDTTAIVNEAQRLLEQVKTGVSTFAEVAKTYTEIPSSETFFKHGELSRVKEDVVFSGKKGEILGPIKDFDGVHLIQVLDQKQGTTEFVKASHILLSLVSGPDSVKVIQKAKELLAKVRSGANFAQLAKENSQDYGSGAQGGELGWSSKDRWVKPFADAAFKARVGEIVGPIRTQFGWHIIKVTGKDKREVKILDLALKVKASSQTLDGAFQQAQDFGILSKDEGYEKAAENSKYEVRETPEFQKSGSIPGIGPNDALSNFSFTNKIGAISEPIYVRGGVIVAKVSDVRAEGVRPLDEVKNLVRGMVLKEKKLEKLRPQVEEFYKKLTSSSSLIAAAQMQPEVIAQNTGAFKATDMITGVGREPKFTGTAMALKPGEISKPIDGNRGFYIIKLISKSEIDTTRYSVERESLRSQLLQEKRQQALSQWQTDLREKAVIEDHREKFFR